MFNSKDKTQKIFSHGSSTYILSADQMSVICVSVIYTQMLRSVLSKHLCQYGLFNYLNFL